MYDVDTTPCAVEDIEILYSLFSADGVKIANISLDDTRYVPAFVAVNIPVVGFHSAAFCAITFVHPAIVVVVTFGKD